MNIDQREAFDVIHGKKNFDGGMRLPKMNKNEEVFYTLETNPDGIQILREFKLN
jgi:hypothetical protein